QDPLNGMGCSSLYPLVDTVLRQGEQIGLYYGHPHFEPFFTHGLNALAGVYFDYRNYAMSVQSCGITDSLLVRRHISTFRVRAPNRAALEWLADSLQNLRAWVPMEDMILFEGGGPQLVFGFRPSDSLDLGSFWDRLESLATSWGLEADYLPHFGRDTLAQVLVHDFEVSSGSTFEGLLAVAFPDLEVSVVQPDLIRYYIFGHSTPSLAGYSYYLTLRHPVTDGQYRSEEHTSELQSRENLVCRLLLEKKKRKTQKLSICCL